MREQKPDMMTNGLMRAVWLGLGSVSFMLGALGIVLPILPTTPFMILAAFCFARSSKRVHDYLVNHKTFGSAIRDWQYHGAISRRAKILAVSSMILILTASLIMSLSPIIIAIQALAMAGSATFILSRPLPPKVQ